MQRGSLNYCLAKLPLNFERSPFEAPTEQSWDAWYEFEEVHLQRTIGAI
jgi:hypothetical protein